MNIEKEVQNLNPEKDRKFLQGVQYFHVLPIANAISPFPIGIFLLEMCFYHLQSITYFYW
jgi:hypothetical protein